jgi:uncharacterized membrane protein (DUF441 family)
MVVHTLLLIRAIFLSCPVFPLTDQQGLPWFIYLYQAPVMNLAPANGITQVHIDSQH